MVWKVLGRSYEPPGASWNYSTIVVLPINLLIHIIMDDFMAVGWSGKGQPHPTECCWVSGGTARKCTKQKEFESGTLTKSARLLLISKDTLHISIKYLSDVPEGMSL